MKKRKTSFGLIAVLVPLVGAILVFNAKEHSAEEPKQNEPPPQTKGEPTSISSDQLKSHLNQTSNAPSSKPQSPKMPGGGPPGRESMVVDPRHAPTANGRPNPAYANSQPKPDLTNSTQGQWYSNDSASH